MDAQAFVLQLLTGLSRSAVLFIVAAGLSLVFGAMRVVNIAHGSFYMIGAFMAATVMATIGGAGGFALAFLAAAAVVAALASVVEVGALRRLYDAEHLLQLLATFAFVLIFADLVQFLWGEQPRRIVAPRLIGGAVNLGGIVFPRYSLFLIGTAIVLAIGLWALMSKTGLGRDIRAAVSDPQMLRMVGVNVPLLFTVVFALGGALAAIGGVLAAPQTTARLGMDVESFAVVIIGGLGSLLGTAVGALLVGVTFTFGIYFFPTAALAVVFVVMIAVLAWRPWGLFGMPER